MADAPCAVKRAGRDGAGRRATISGSPSPAWVQAACYPAPVQEAGTLCLHDLAVAPDALGKGLARRLA